MKLAPPRDVQVDTIILNGAECEPYLTTDHRIMVEYPERVHLGARIMMRTLGARRVVIGVERNKPDAIAALERTRPTDIDVTILPLTVKYPQGAEKMLIKSVTGREVPSGKLPVSLGVVVQNVGSAASIAEIFDTGLPLLERIVTVSGPGVREPANLIVPVGTKLRDLLAACGGLTDDAEEIVFGGPMMGVAQSNLDVPIVKGTTGVDRADDAGRQSRRFVPVHSLRALPRGVPGVPQSVGARRLRAQGPVRGDGGDAPAGLHAVRFVLVRVSVEDPARAALSGEQGGAPQAQAGGDSMTSPTQTSRPLENRRHIGR